MHARIHTAYIHSGYRKPLLLATHGLSLFVTGPHKARDKPPQAPICASNGMFFGYNFVICRPIPTKLATWLHRNALRHVRHKFYHELCCSNFVSSVPYCPHMTKQFQTGNETTFGPQRSLQALSSSIPKSPSIEIIAERDIATVLHLTPSPTPLSYSAVE